jgi:hypothetical protein
MYPSRMSAYPGPRTKLRGLRGLGFGPFYGGSQPPSPAAQTPTVQTQLQTGSVPSQNPLEYVSPQAAIAAGLPSGPVMQAWTQALAAFATPTAAVNAGIPAAVVTQLFEPSRAYVANNPSWFDQTTLGISNGLWLAGALAGAAALLVFGKER